MTQAAVWYVKIRTGTPTEAERQDFERWLARDPANAAAFRQYEALWASLGPYGADAEVLALRRKLLTAAGHRRLEAAQWRGAALAASLLVCLAVIGMAVFSALHRGQAYSTSLGQHSIVRLEDASTVELNTESKIETAYTPTERAVTLVRGQALFQVARDAARPFVVYVADRRIVALGTAFDVRLSGEAVRITLVEGRVAVTSSLQPGQRSSPEEGWPGEERTSAERLILLPGEQLIASATGSARVRATDATAVTSWRDGRLMFSDEPLADAVAEVNRYSRVKIEVSDPMLTGYRVSGVFRTGQTSGFISALEARFPIRVEEHGSRRIVLRHR